METSYAEAAADNLEEVLEEALPFPTNRARFGIS